MAVGPWWANNPGNNLWAPPAPGQQPVDPMDVVDAIGRARADAPRNPDATDAELAAHFAGWNEPMYGDGLVGRSYKLAERARNKQNRVNQLGGWSNVLQQRGVTPSAPGASLYNLPVGGMRTFDPGGGGGGMPSWLSLLPRPGFGPDGGIGISTLRNPIGPLGGLLSMFAGGGGDNVRPGAFRQDRLRQYSTERVKHKDDGTWTFEDGGYKFDFRQVKGPMFDYYEIQDPKTGEWTAVDPHSGIGTNLGLEQEKIYLGGGTDDQFNRGAFGAGIDPNQRTLPWTTFAQQTGPDYAPFTYEGSSRLLDQDTFNTAQGTGATVFQNGQEYVMDEGGTWQPTGRTTQEAGYETDAEANVKTLNFDRETGTDQGGDFEITDTTEDGDPTKITTTDEETAAEMVRSLMKPRLLRTATRQGLRTMATPLLLSSIRRPILQSWIR